MIVKRRTEKTIERIYNQFYGNGYMTKEKSEEQKEKCLNSVIDLDEMGPKIAEYMSQMEQKEYRYMHGLFLCYDTEGSRFPLVHIQCQEFHEFCGILKDNFHEPIFYKTYQGLPVFKIDKTFGEIKSLYLAETFLDTKAEIEIGEFSFYFPNTSTREIMESPKIHRPYLRMMLREYLIEKRQEKENKVQRKTP